MYIGEREPIARSLVVLIAPICRDLCFIMLYDLVAMIIIIIYTHTYAHTGSKIIKSEKAFIKKSHRCPVSHGNKLRPATVHVIYLYKIQSL